MIESIHIADVATYGRTAELMGGLSKINFIYGSNGSGKTTISKVIAGEYDYSGCCVTWKGGTRLQPMVYNRDFVKRNFNETADLKGIFTLGEQNIDTLNKIATATKEKDQLTQDIETLKKTLQGIDGAGGKIAELALLDSKFRDICWSQKQKYDPNFADAFEGLRNNKEKFRDRFLQELSANSSTLEALTDLEKRAQTIFGSTPTSEALIALPATNGLVAHESNSILNKRIIGKDEVDIAAMISKLGNSDWVKEGRNFFAVNDNVCPFCQQHTPNSLAKSLEEYFDEAFEQDSKAIGELETNYKTESERINQQIETIVATPSKFLDVEKLKIEKDLLKSKTNVNIQRISTKKKEPSQKVELESTLNVLATIKAIIDAANVNIENHNKMVMNFKQEHKILTGQVWRYLIDKELKGALTEYQKNHDSLIKAIESLRTKIVAAEAAKKAKILEIGGFEKSVTSIQPTIDGINALLKAFGFLSFSIEKANCGTCYKLVRADGSDAKQTLSEGEISFVTFLYFYHLLKGSDLASGVTTDRVVVFDDPVSSLDSDILFIVSSLIKEIFKEIQKGAGQIKQIFVLTHNVYFHKEVTFCSKGEKEIAKCRTFWVVRKSGLESKLTKCDKNPIKTSYEMLWKEVQSNDQANPSIQNALRRILEYYFKFLGGRDFDDICNKFEGKDKLVCKALFSWAHAGSHSIFDDQYISIGETSVEKYLKIFQEIFINEGQHEHYKMMMGDAYVESEATPTIVQEPSQ